MKARKALFWSDRGVLYLIQVILYSYLLLCCVVGEKKKQTVIYKSFLPISTSFSLLSNIHVL